MGEEWSASLPDGALLPGERTACTHWIGGLVDLRAGLDTELLHLRDRIYKNIRRLYSWTLTVILLASLLGLLFIYCPRKLIVPKRGSRFLPRWRCRCWSLGCLVDTIISEKRAASIFRAEMC